MNLAGAFRAGAWLGAAVALVAGFLEVLGMVAGVVPAYQRGATLGLAAFAVVLYGLVGLVGGAALGGALWLAGVRSRMRPMLAALQGSGWFLAIGVIILNQSFRYQPTPTAVVVILNAGLLVAAVGVGILMGGLEHARGQWGLRWLSLAPVAALALSGVGLLSDAWPERLSPSPGQPAVAPSATRPNVILIVMDTTRADHLSAYGYGRQTTPAIDRLAAEGARFDAVMAPSSWTLPSVASIMTGLLPGAHGADHGSLFLDDDRVTLAEILREQGYVTGGFIGGPFCKAIFGLAQGFDTYDDALTPRVMNLALVRVTAKGLHLNTPAQPERRADQINDVVLPWLERRAHRPFFLFINYFDPHDPYQPPDQYAGRWAAPNGLDGVIERPAFWRRAVKGLPPLTPAERDQLLGLYDGEIAFMDARIGRLVETLARLDLLDRTILIVTADHGESFGEHRLILHGNALYEDQVRIPLIIRFPPRVRPGTVVASPVHGVDIMPTVLELLDLRAPAGLHGVSLLPLNASRAPRDERSLVAELRRGGMWSGLSPRFDRDLLALRRGPWKYIVSSAGTAELYHLQEDPAEVDNRARLEPELVGRLHRDALALMTRQDARRSRRPLDWSTREQLKAFGY